VHGDSRADALRCVLCALPAPGAAAPPTLLCWVLIDPANGHDFCSRFDFDTSPLLSCSATIPAAWEATLRRRGRGCGCVCAEALALCCD
jgi:hypothetical protein